MENLAVGSLVIHLTLTGVAAGRPLCDCDKDAERRAGATFMHAVYAPPAVFTDARLCTVCKAEWEAAA